MENKEVFLKIKKFILSSDLSEDEKDTMMEYLIYWYGWAFAEAMTWREELTIEDKTYQQLTIYYKKQRHNNI